jgi:hypothetical protein
MCDWGSGHVNPGTVHGDGSGMERAIIRIESWLIEGVAETLPWVELSAVQKWHASLGGICPGTRGDAVSVNSAGSVSPCYGGACGDVDVKRLEGVVNNGDRICRIRTSNDLWGELERRSNDESNESNCCYDLAYSVLRKRGLRPFDGAASMLILVLA